MARAVGYMDDLFFQMKIAETAKQLGIDFKAASNLNGLNGLLDPPTRMVIVDLNARDNPIATIQSLRATHRDLPVLAFFSHVQTDLAAQARAAGCTDVMARSAFTQNLASILAVAKD